MERRVVKKKWEKEGLEQLIEGIYKRGGGKDLPPDSIIRGLDEGGGAIRLPKSKYTVQELVGEMEGPL